MSSAPESILRSPPEILRKSPEKEAGDDSDPQYPSASKDQDGANVKTFESNVGQEILRNLSSETPSTAYSSGINSLDLLMEIYPSISESGSNHGDSQNEDNENTVIHVNHSKDSNENMSFFSLASHRTMVSQWLEDKPFDEESLRALSEILSERGESLENVFSKGFDRQEEYILPPANYTRKFAGQSVDEKGDTKKASANTRSASPMMSTLTVEFIEEPNESVNRSYQQKKLSNKKSSSGKFCWVWVLCALILLAVAILLGFMTSRIIHEKRLQNQATAASGNGESTPSSPPFNMTDDRPWGTLITYFDPIPEEVFPLGLCAGDCDRDADCAEGLVCYQRGANDPVPYCYDGENDASRNDYCTYPSFTGEMPGSESEPEECVTSVSVTQECFLSTDNVIVVNFQNCDPQDGDWIGLYPNGTTLDYGTTTELAAEDYINWAYTCGTNDCSDSPFNNAIGLPTEHNNGFDIPLLAVYLLRDSAEGPPFTIVAKSEPFVPTEICE
mmetsp:Transcript_3045/g.7177  ORF Transcript_3045/g.7177 Transcript_3045/m.7177 type:complete len:502 (+) Transcript_3045:209-1714(+)